MVPEINRPSSAVAAGIFHAGWGSGWATPTTAAAALALTTGAAACSAAGGDGGGDGWGGGRGGRDRECGGGDGDVAGGSGALGGGSPGGGPLGGGASGGELEVASCTATHANTQVSWQQFGAPSVPTPALYCVSERSTGARPLAHVGARLGSQNPTSHHPRAGPLRGLHP